MILKTFWAPVQGSSLIVKDYEPVKSLYHLVWTPAGIHNGWRFRIDNFAR